MAVIGFGGMALAASSGSPVALVAAAVVGAVLGFLVFNFPPARVFLGDAGSIPLGFLAAALGLLGWAADQWPLWFPVMVFSPFIADASLTLARRLVAGERVWQAHRDHGYQRLILSGWSHRKTALAAYGLMAAGAAGALALRPLSPAAQATGLAGWLGVLCWVFVALELRWRRFVRTQS
jgi:UDP-N-acetylmuramyl pentapeptide phosphotransferase/UDP-N-acetylglucosamine-1-phosphate transferase